MAFKIDHSGFCPDFGENNTIEITVTEIKALGMRGYKKTGFLCEHAAEDNCDYLLKGDECPVYKNFKADDL